MKTTEIPPTLLHMKVGCTDCDIGPATPVSSIVECQAKCNQTTACDAIVISDTYYR